MPNCRGNSAIKVGFSFDCQNLKIAATINRCEMMKGPNGEDPMKDPMKGISANIFPPLSYFLSRCRSWKHTSNLSYPSIGSFIHNGFCYACCRMVMNIVHPIIGLETAKKEVTRQMWSGDWLCDFWRLLPWDSMALFFRSISFDWPLFAEWER